MELTFKHGIYYDFKGHSSLPDIAHTLLSIDSICSEMTTLSNEVSQEFHISRIQADLLSIRTGSLYEDLLLKIFCTAQEDIEDHIDGNFRKEQEPNHLKRTVGYLLPIIAITGGIYANSYIEGLKEPTELKKAQNQAIEITGDNCDVDINVVNNHFENMPPKRKKKLAKDAASLFAPSKEDSNSSITLSPDIILSPRALSEVPSPALLDAAQPEVWSETLPQVEVIIRAKDKDRAKSGWGAVVPIIGDDRAALKLAPHISPSRIYNKDLIIGDVLAIFTTKADGTVKVKEFHLIGLME